MPKGQSISMRLTKNTPAYEAIKAKIDILWEEHGPDFDSYPAPKILVDEFKELLLPFAPNQDQKCRDLIRRLVNNKFLENGQLFMVTITDLLTIIF